MVEAQEFHEIRLRGGEKRLYREINKGNGIRFPIKVDIALPSHKRSLIIQAELGGVEFPADEQFAKHRKQYQDDKIAIFSHIHRLIKCVIDCQIYLREGVSIRHALELLRSFSARVWDNSPFQMKQIPQIGLVAIRKLISGGISCIDSLEAAEPHKIEMLLSKNPPFGMKLLTNLKDFPKLRVSVKMIGKVEIFLATQIIIIVVTTWSRNVKEGNLCTLRSKQNVHFLTTKSQHISQGDKYSSVS